MCVCNIVCTRPPEYLNRARTRLFAPYICRFVVVAFYQKCGFITIIVKAMHIKSTTMMVKATFEMSKITPELLLLHRFACTRGDFAIAEDNS